MSIVYKKKSVRIYADSGMIIKMITPDSAIYGKNIACSLQIFNQSVVTEIREEDYNPEEYEQNDGEN